MLPGIGSEGGVRVMINGLDMADQLYAAAGVTGALLAFLPAFMLPLLAIISFYLLDCLSAERRDRSILFFKSLPVELDEAARIDGAGFFTIYRRIIMPLSGPVTATVAILTFLPIWNSYLWPLMVTQTEASRPVMVGVSFFFQMNTPWGELMAYLTLITIPVLVLFLAIQRTFVESIAASGVKG